MNDPWKFKPRSEAVAELQNLASTKPYPGTTRLIRTQVLDHERLNGLTAHIVVLWCALIVYILFDQFIRG